MGLGSAIMRTERDRYIRAKGTTNNPRGSWAKKAKSTRAKISRRVGKVAAKQEEMK